MPRTHSTKPRSKLSASSIAEPSGEVLTLAEAAAYLRIPQDEVLRTVAAGDLPGRLLGDEWRFLKSALQDWLRMPAPPSSKEALRSAIGSWKNHPDLDELLEDIYRQRGRPMVEERE